MPVSDQRAFRLLRAFGQLEYKLKLLPAYLRADRNRNAMVDWRAVKASVEALPADRFSERISQDTRDKVFGDARNRPKVQLVLQVGGRPKARFVARDLSASPASALVEAAKRVRNNLFHGGKEDPGEQPFDGDDNQWAEAALDITQALLDLVDAGAFGPAEP